MTTFPRIAVAKAVKTAMTAEALKPVKVAEILGINDGYINLLDNDSDLDKIPSGPWTKILDWFTSKKTLEEYAGKSEIKVEQKDKLPNKAVDTLDISEQEAISKAVFSAIKKEGLTFWKAANHLGVHENYMTWLNKKENFHKVPRLTWIALREWMNSGKSISSEMRESKLIVRAKPISSMVKKDKVSKRIAKMKLKNTPLNVLAKAIKQPEMKPETQDKIIPDDSNYARAAADLGTDNTLGEVPAEDMGLRVKPSILTKRAEGIIIGDVQKDNKKLIISKPPISDLLKELIKNQLYGQLVDSVELVVTLK